MAIVYTMVVRKGDFLGMFSDYNDFSYEGAGVIYDYLNNVSDTIKCDIGLEYNSIRREWCEEDVNAVKKRYKLKIGKSKKSKETLVRLSGGKYVF